MAAPPSSVSPPLAVGSCAAMAVFYVAVLYSPTVLLRLPPPTSLNAFLLRRFACAALSAALSLLASSLLLGVWRSGELSIASVLRVYGVRSDRMWQAVIFPLFLTSLLYAGSFASKLWLLSSACNLDCFKICALRCVEWARRNASNILAWRNLVVAPITEEIVFRACMTPLLLCGGFKTYSIIFFSPIFFSLAHLNHLMELYFQQNYSFLKALLTVGLQLGYTVIFGWYASFLFIRTGNLISPIVAHIFCNLMGLPVFLPYRTKGVASIAFAAGLVGFIRLLFPITSSGVYNERTDDCSCWQGYCSWN